MDSCNNSHSTLLCLFSKGRVLPGTEESDRCMSQIKRLGSRFSN
uniref:Uncharacterized protein n=1 Tax=Anguilla anguilla TaxID=7936 RepID=A0A0E9W5Y7_ANGAN